MFGMLEDRLHKIKPLHNDEQNTEWMLFMLSS